MTGRGGEAELASIRLSLAYGRGDVHWFAKLSHADQVLVLAATTPPLKDAP